MLLGLMLVAYTSNGQNLDLIHLIPGQGIVINSDSILKEKITIDKLCNLLKIKYNKDARSFDLMSRDWINMKTGKMEGDTRIIEEIQYKSIVFRFASKHFRDIMKLDRIEIKDPEEFIIFTSDGYSLSGPNPRFQELFTFVKGSDSYSSDRLTISLNTYALWIQLKKIGGDYRISDLSMSVEGERSKD